MFDIVLRSRIAGDPCDSPRLDALIAETEGLLTRMRSLDASELQRLAINLETIADCAEQLAAREEGGLSGEQDE